MASIEGLTDTSSATLSPSVTPSLNHVDISLRTQHDSLSPPLTPSLNHADISLPTQHGSSSPLSPQSGDSPLDELKQLEHCMDVRRSLENHQRDQQILSQFDQLLHHQPSATADSLVEDATDLGAILLSLANVEQLLFPHKLVSSIIEESKEKPLLLFILDKIYQLRKELQLPHRHLLGKIKHLKEYVNDLYIGYCNIHGVIPFITRLPMIEDPFLVVLASMKDRRPDIGPINYWGVKRTEFAIILGCFVGSAGGYVPADVAHTHSLMLQIGTAVARGRLQDYPQGVSGNTSNADDGLAILSQPNALYRA